MNKEIWKPITEFDGEYEISSLGRVRSVNNNCIMQPSINVAGKPQVNFRFNKKGKTRTIESLLLKEFFNYIPRQRNLPTNEKIIYRDGDRKNVAINNIIVPSLVNRKIA